MKRFLLFVAVSAILLLSVSSTFAVYTTQRSLLGSVSFDVPVQEPEAVSSGKLSFDSHVNRVTVQGAAEGSYTSEAWLEVDDAAQRFVFHADFHLTQAFPWLGNIEATLSVTSHYDTAVNLYNNAKGSDGASTPSIGQVTLQPGESKSVPFSLWSTLYDGSALPDFSQSWTEPAVFTYSITENLMEYNSYQSQAYYGTSAVVRIFYDKPEEEVPAKPELNGIAVTPASEVAVEAEWQNRYGGSLVSNTVSVSEGSRCINAGLIYMLSPEQCAGDGADKCFTAFDLYLGLSNPHDFAVTYDLGGVKGTIAPGANANVDLKISKNDVLAPDWNSETFATGAERENAFERTVTLDYEGGSAQSYTLSIAVIITLPSSENVDMLGLEPELTEEEKQAAEEAKKLEEQLKAEEEAAAKKAEEEAAAKKAEEEAAAKKAEEEAAAKKAEEEAAARKAEEEAAAAQRAAEEAAASPPAEGE